MGTRWARFVRGWLAALVSTFVAVCSHTIAAGHLPSLVGVVLCLAFSGPVCIVLSGKSLSLVRLSISVVVSQFLFHGAFGLLADGTPAAPGTMEHGHGAMPHDLDALAGGPVPGHAMTTDARMWLGHAIAAVLTIAALRFGEHAFWALIGLGRLGITRMLGDPPRIAGAILPRASAVAADRALLPHDLGFVFSTLRFRGPPLGTVPL
ncbi:MAG TPA: hypothetical protein VGC18_00485 [Lacisediminihabitans sp.]|uniref:hypothetical protein n=1 Tax=Lacisediminihabitans sp. TaxID=2787631 RepID=UPI002EDAEA9C